MPALCLYIFNRAGTCLHYKEWNRPRGPVGKNRDDDAKMVFGLVFTLQTLCANMDPTPRRKPLGQKLFIGDGCGFQSFVTNTYRLHYFQSPSGIKFVLMTSPEHEDCKELLRAIYARCFCTFVCRNPLCKLGEKIDNDGFTRALEEVVAPLQAAKAG